LKKPLCRDCSPTMRVPVVQLTCLRHGCRRGLRALAVNPPVRSKLARTRVYGRSLRTARRLTALRAQGCLPRVAGHRCPGCAGGPDVLEEGRRHSLFSHQSEKHGQGTESPLPVSNAGGPLAGAYPSRGATSRQLQARGVRRCEPQDSSRRNQRRMVRPNGEAGYDLICGELRAGEAN
jgi:hypothetical protein